jgi:O-antigen/teichoic acid export membrane protein
MAQGVAWMSAARLAIRGLGLISTFVLARLLGPEDFGLIAMASAVIALADVLRAFSFDSALLQRDAERSDYSTAWTLNVLLGTGIGVLLAAGAPLVAAAYGDTRVTGILMVLAAAFAVGGFFNTGTVDFRKNLDFRRDFSLMVAQKVIAFVATLALAFWLRSYWAMAFGSLVSALAGVLMSYVMHPLRPRFTLVSQRKLVNFSKWMLLSNFAAFLNSKTADMALGRLGGASVAGIFSVANDVATLATTELVAPINRAVLPGYVRLAADPVELRKAFAMVLGFIALVACPAALGIGALSEPLVNLVLGAQWTATIGLIQVLSVGAAMNAMLTNSVSVYLAVGRPNLIALMSAIHTCTLIPLLIGGILLNGAMGAAWGHLLQVAFVTMPTTYFLLVRFTPITVRDILGSIWRPVVAATIMAVAVRWLVDALGTASSALPIQLVLGVVGGATIYTATTLVLWRAVGAPAGAERVALDFLRTRIPRRLTAS